MPWLLTSRRYLPYSHDDVIIWKYFQRYWPFVRGIHRSPVNSTHKGRWSGALMFSLICAQINGWVNNGGAGDLRRHRAHYDVIVIGEWVLVEKQQCPWLLIMTWKCFLHHWPSVWGIRRWPDGFPHKKLVMRNLRVCFVISIKKLLCNFRIAGDLRCLTTSMTLL